jgi:Photosynthetic reaction centre cytochrome C subunit/Tetratricopeptide repeat
MTKVVLACTLVAVTVFADAPRAQSPAPSPTQSAPLPPARPAPQPPVRRPSVLPQNVGDRMAYMRTISEALGVDCGYCHGGRGGNTPATQPVTAAGRQRVEVAREMFQMVERLNASVREATGKAPSEVTRVTCATCHRGVPIPMQISDIVWQTSLKQGGESAVAQYRELREKFYGRQAYDFGEQALILVTERLANVKPDAAVALLRMNLEFHPGSVQSHISLAYALTRARDYQGAISALRDALRLEPGNGVARGMLAQLDQ